MQDTQIYSTAPTAGLINLTHIIYGLHTFAIITGIVGSATIVGSFLGSLPSILAVILNYARRSETRGTWLASHFSWQIRTFWLALLWVVIAVLLAFTLIGLPLTICILIGLTLWVIYRIGRGWLALNEQRTVP